MRKATKLGLVLLLLVFACVSIVIPAYACGGGAGATAHIFSGTKDTAIQSFTTGVRVGKWLANPIDQAVKWTVIKSLRVTGLLQGEVPNIPEIQLLSEVIPLGQLIFSAPVAISE